MGAECHKMVQGGQDVVNWLLQTAISDKNYRYVDLWNIEAPVMLN